MKSSRVAKRYARALLGLSDDHAQLETWGAELERLARIADAPEIALRLASPEVSHEARVEAMAKIAERLDLSYPMRSLAVVVARHGRIADLTAVSQSYQEQL
ncbi:MAG: F0F1 ATP synthase subunit delta, partial [Candidatus Binataceae bacterium]